MIELFRCERLSANISRRQCEVNRQRIGSSQFRTGDPIFACEGCPGLGLDAVSLDTEAVTMAKCKVPGCEKFVTKDGYCWGHCKSVLGINPKTGKPLAVLSPSPALAVADPTTIDPRVTFECPHCHCALASNEVDLPNCPMCDGRLHTHVDQAGEVFTPPAEAEPATDSQVVTDILPDGAFAVDGAGRRDGRVTNMDGEQVEFGVDPVIFAALDEALSDLRTSLLIDLSGLAPGRAICETYRKLERIQTLRG